MGREGRRVKKKHGKVNTVLSTFREKLRVEAGEVLGLIKMFQGHYMASRFNSFKGSSTTE